mmetsp:Transcript_1938/g.2358  ORF Transcript_1938/g.2358 Transcript_1938/m.2358 type:complete len:157 (-) Transcript_1938:262-732(-)
MKTIATTFLTLAFFATKKTAYAVPTIEGCHIKSTVSCHLTSHQNQDCHDIQMEPNICEDIPVTFSYRYCNLHETQEITYANGEIDINHGLDTVVPIQSGGKLHPMTCKLVKLDHVVNSCTHAFQASMVIDGWIGNELKCHHSDDYRFVRPLFQAIE